MWRRLKFRIGCAVIAFGAVVAADIIAHAEPRCSGPISMTTPHTPYRYAGPRPSEAFRSGMQALQEGRADQAVIELESAAGQGVPGAIWKLGRMYADGDGVKMNKARAYQ